VSTIIDHRFMSFMKLIKYLK